MRKLTRLAQVTLSVLGVVPTINLVRALERMNAHWVVARDYRVLSVALAETGAWAFIFLYLALACTPLQRFTGFRFPIDLRRTLGLLAFYYVLLHFAVYLVVGQKWHFEFLIPDARLTHSRIPGYLSMILLIPLALTSTDGMIRRLGGKRWRWLHRLVYPAAALAIVHLWWSEVDNMTDFQRTKNAAVPFVILMLLRVLSPRKSAPTRSSPDP